MTQYFYINSSMQMSKYLIEEMKPHFNSFTANLMSMKECEIGFDNRKIFHSLI